MHCKVYKTDFVVEQLVEDLRKVATVVGSERFKLLLLCGFKLLSFLAAIFNKQCWPATRK